MGRAKKVERFKITEFKNTSGTRSWRVSGTKSDSKRVRENYSDKADALQRRLELENEYDDIVKPTALRQTSLSEQELADAESAYAIANGTPLNVITNTYNELTKVAAEKDLKPSDVIHFFKKFYREEIKEISLKEASELFLTSKKNNNLSHNTVEHLKYSLNLLLKDQPYKSAHKFSVHDIEKALAPYTKAESKRTFRNGLNTFFNWCMRHHYCQENPVERLDKIPRDMTQISILSLDEVKRLLQAAITFQGGVCVSTIAIALFAGVRPSELKDLASADIKNGNINVTGGKLKRKLNRIVPIPPVLAAWLNEYPFTGLPSGWNYKYKQLKKATDAKEWVQDIMRHTSISYQIERDKNEALTAFNNGTSKQMIDFHYRNNIEDEDALKLFWNLTPHKLKDLSVKVKVYKKEKKIVEWPDDKKLKKMLSEKSLVAIGKELNVSDNAVRKRCKAKGLI